MINKRNALGRGLDSLIRMDEVRTDGSSAISEIEISRIEPNPEQPRRTFDEETLSESLPPRYGSSEWYSL